MNQNRIASILAPIRRRWRCRRALTLLALGWGAVACAIVFTEVAGASVVPRALAAVVAAIGLAALVAASFSRPSDRRVARLVETRFPELESRLLTAVELPQSNGDRANVFHRQLIAEVAAHAAAHDWRTCIPAKSLVARLLWQVAICAALLGAGFLTRAPIAEELAAGVGDANDSGTIASPVELEIDVDPGDAEIERGGDLLVTARFGGRIPARPVLIADRQGTQDDEPTSRGPESIALVRHLDDPLFGGRIERVARDFTYRVAADGITTREFRVTVFEYPRLERADATLIRPSWTGTPDETLADARRVSVVEGSRVVWSFQFNKPVASATLEAEDGERIDVELIEASEGESAIGRVELSPSEDRDYRLHVVDEAGRANREPPEFAVRVLPNRPPELKLAFPARDVRVSPIEELLVEGTAWDDFGLVRLGIVYEIPGSEPRTLLLDDAVAGREERRFSRTIPLEELNVSPGQLVAYHVFADDVGPKGEPRRTLGDIFFAEVRPFERIYREGQSPPGGQGANEGAGNQQGQPLEQLLKMQKQIVIATWKLRRTRDANADRLALRDDANTIAETQQAAIDRFSEVRSKLRERDLRERKIAEGVGENMERALRILRSAADSNETRETASDDGDLLVAAVAAEQAAFEGLLKLQPREHEVVKGQPAGGGGGDNSRSDQQLDQLELAAKQNRYQTERAASQRSAQARDERLQVLNRLRELAQRQAELNDALRRSEQELLAARAAAEIEEARRRLKRLREEQQKLLEDVDRLRERMDRPENQRELADSREQLDRARSQVRRASEALEAGRASQAVAEGARAEREMRRLGDELRQRTAGEFADAVRELRDQARKLGDDQERIGDELRADESSARQSLRGSRDRDRLENELREQGRRFERVVDDVEKVMQQAEASEPLLSRKLHETLRDADAARPRESLERAASELARDRRDDAQTAEAQARQGIDALRSGVETAAADVLGSELENLRRARREVSDLAEAVRNEMAGSRVGESSSERTADASSDVRQESARSSEESSEDSGKSSGEGESPGEGQASSDTDGPRERSGLRSTRAGRSESGEQPGPGERSGKGERGGQSSATATASQSRGGGSPGGPESPLTGGSGDFEQWSDGLRAVEELVSDPRTRDDVRRIRDRARQMRIEHRRHSRPPNRDLVQAEILAPLAEIRERLSEEIARRDEGGALVPLDRDPVPERYSEQVRRYYEKLGEGR
ncbi:MAG: hypothetical protein WD066_19325 [Planctomycetaceae bacterium]